MCAEILKDVLKPVDQVWMAERFKIAAVARYRRLSGACDDQLPFGQHQKGGGPDAGVSYTGVGIAGGWVTGAAWTHDIRPPTC